MRQRRRCDALSWVTCSWYVCRGTLKPQRVLISNRLWEERRDRSLKSRIQFFLLADDFKGWETEPILNAQRVMLFLSVVFKENFPMNLSWSFQKQYELLSLWLNPGFWREKSPSGTQTAGPMVHQRFSRANPEDHSLLWGYVSLAVKKPALLRAWENTHRSYCYNRKLLSILLYITILCPLFPPHHKITGNYIYSDLT